MILTASLSMEGVELEVCAPALLISREDLPHSDPDVDLILGQNITSSWGSSNIKDLINRLIVAFAPRMPSHPNNPHHWGAIDILAYDDPWEGIVYAQTGRKDFTSV